jgi:catalase
VRSATGDDLQADRAMNTMASVLYDAVVVPGGSESVQALSADGHAVHFVAEAFKHAKPVGASARGRTCSARHGSRRCALRATTNLSWPARGS